MASSSPRSGSPDTEDCESEIKSTLSLSVGYFPCEDNSSFEETILLEDTTPDVCLSHNLIPPIQGTWGTESIRRRISQRNLIQDNPQQICKLGIIVAWAENDDFKESTAFENLREGRGLLDRCPKDQTKLTEKKLDDLMKLLKTFQDVHEDEDENKKHNQENQKCDQQNNKENKRNYKDDDFDGLILTSIKDPKLYHSSPAHAPQVCQHKRDTGQNLPRRKSPGNKDVQFPEVSPILQEQEFAKMEGEVSCIADTFSVFAEQLEEDTLSDTQIISCLRLGQAFRWLQETILLILRRRQNPEVVTKRHQHQAPKRRRTLRNKKIQPEELLRK